MLNDNTLGACEHQPRPRETAREVAIGRLMTMVNEPTPERRRNHAEWVVDAILAAASEVVAR